MNVMPMLARSPENLDGLSATHRQLVEENLGLVARVASRWRRRCRTRIDYADLLQVGALGLIDAAARYDVARCASFAAFAQERIRGAIMDHLRELDPLTRGRRQAVRQLEEATASLALRLVREPRLDEVAAQLGWSTEALLEARQDLASLKQGMANSPLPGEFEADAMPWGFAATEDACDVLLRAELKQQLVAGIKELPERQQLVLSLHYVEELTMREIGSILGVTESRVSQIHSMATKALRASLMREGVMA